MLCAERVLDVGVVVRGAAGAGAGGVLAAGAALHARRPLPRPAARGVSTPPPLYYMTLHHTTLHHTT